MHSKGSACVVCCVCPVRWSSCGQVSHLGISVGSIFERWFALSMCIFYMKIICFCSQELMKFCMSSVSLLFFNVVFTVL